MLGTKLQIYKVSSSVASRLRNCTIHTNFWQVVYFRETNVQTGRTSLPPFWLSWLHYSPCNLGLQLFYIKNTNTQPYLFLFMTRTCMLWPHWYSVILLLSCAVSVYVIFFLQFFNKNSENFYTFVLSIKQSINKLLLFSHTIFKSPTFLSEWWKPPIFFKS